MQASKIHVLQLVIALILLPFLFIGGPEYYRFRLLPYVWNIGHIVLFWAVTSMVLNRYAIFFKRFSIWLVPALILMIVVISIPVEFIQGVQSRTASAMDILRNCAGGLVAVAFSREFALNGRVYRRSIRFLSLLVVFLLMLPLFANSVDSVYASRQFPVLADFEADIQVLRWSGEQINIVDDPDDKANKLLKVEFNTDQYSGVTLEYVVGDWSKYKNLWFRVYNPLDKDTSGVLRIHDERHKYSHWEFNDRYNKRLALNPGWNQFYINIESIRRAPKTRSMDMADLEKMTFFTINLEENLVLYFDDFKLR